MISVSIAKKEDCPEIARIHKEAIATGFLSQLGERFLALFYEAVVFSSSAFLFVTKEDGKVIGFVSGCFDIEKFYRAFFKNYFFRAGFILLPQILINPAILRKISEVIKYPEAEKGKQIDLPKAELLTLAVDIEFRGRGIAQDLFSEFLEEMKKQHIKKFKLVVGADNPRAIRFYEKMGFKLHSDIIVHKPIISKIFIYEIKGEFIRKQNLLSGEELIASFVSIIIPMRNEERNIKRCLDYLISQDYPKEKMEIIVVDGMSEDKSREIVQDFTKRFGFIQLLENPKKIVPVALNLGIRRSRGEYILRADAHTIYDKNYISKCLEHLKKTGADCVGGVLKTLPSGESFVAQAIALALSQPFGAGGTTFRTERGAGFVDTVPFGAYRREIFERLGFFNEKLVRNQDIELNSRIRKMGGKIYITPEIKLSYFASSTLNGLASQQFKNGLWNIYTQKLVPGSLRLRHFVPFCFVVGLFGSLILGLFSFFGQAIFILILGSYFFVNLLFSVKISLHRGLKYLFILPIAFFVLHFSYGLGSIGGVITIWKVKNN